MGLSIIEGQKAERMAAALELIATAQAGNIQAITDYKVIEQLARAGLAGKYFNYGDQIVPRWAPAEGTEYDLDLDAVHFGDVVNAQDETVPGLWLQSHWGLTGIQFDASEAIWYCSEALPAGTYHFAIGANWGTHVVGGKSYQFTTTTDLAIGSQIVIGTDTSFYTWGAPDVAVSKWRVYTFANAKSITPIDTLTLTEGTDGTDLGTLSASTKYGETGLNNIQRAAYGYNRWGHSAIRQWLNSDKAAGAWWEPQNVYDRPPQQLATVRGFLAGLPEDFLEVVKPVKVTTALNTISDSVAGSPLIGAPGIENRGTAAQPVLVETTLDRFFLPSIEQEYIVPQLSGAEGVYWPYWKQRLGLSSPQGSGSTYANANHIRYAIENHASAQYARLRSASRGGAYYAWHVTTSGFASSTNATTVYRPVPACVIC